VHESALARRILDAALAHAERAGAVRVRVVRGWVSETEALSQASLALHFAAHARGTPADGAHLELRLSRVEARCRSCGRVWAPDHHVVLCPSCGGVEADLLGRTGFGVDAIEVE
jgi:hydrogenase nickel incorporation protein HypA/HybF